VQVWVLGPDSGMYGFSFGSGYCRTDTPLSGHSDLGTVLDQSYLLRLLIFDEIRRMLLGGSELKGPIRWQNSDQIKEFLLRDIDER
jgi:hypothetical protein